MNKEQLQQQVKELKEKLKELEQSVKDIEKSGWEPKYNEVYYCILGTGEVKNDIWEECPADRQRLAQGTALKTLEEAKKEAKIMRVRAKLKHLSKKSMNGVVLKGVRNVYYIYYCVDNEQFNAQHCSVLVLNPYPFLTIVDAQNAIKEIGEDNLKLYFGVEN